MTRTARCHCGAVTVEVPGEPQFTFMCHCEFCQRRTGTSYHLDAWFSREGAIITGETRTYTRSGDRGDSLVFHFCPNCGSNVYFYLPAVLPDMIGVAVGCFADPGFPAPQASLYEYRRHRWVEVPAGTIRHERGVTL